MEETMELRIICNTLLGGAVAVIVTGCASTVRQTALPAPRPLGAQYVSVGGQTSDAGNPASSLAEPTGPLNLAQALALALMRNPELEAFSHDMRAAEALALQARLFTNPELEFGVGEYDRGGRGSKSADTDIMLGQLFELGGKRRRRVRVAEASGDLAGWDYESTRLDVFAETTRRFVRGMASQRRVALFEEVMKLAEKTARAVEERVKAGKEPPLQAAKANAALEMARLDGFTARSALDAARANLAAMWGAEEVRFDTLEGDFDAVSDRIPSLDVLLPRLAESPELSRWEAEIRLREAILASERAARVPDVKGVAGLQRFEEDKTDAIAFGVEFPLPLFDRNQGNVAAAKHELEKAHAVRRAARTSLKAELIRAHAEFASAHQRTVTLRSKVIPAVEQAYKAAHEGYRQGKFGFLDMLDAQRGLFEARASMVDALVDYHAARVAIERLTATDIKQQRK